MPERHRWAGPDSDFITTRGQRDRDHAEERPPSYETAPKPVSVSVGERREASYTTMCSARRERRRCGWLLVVSDYDIERLTSGRFRRDMSLTYSS